jgi:hypothetical protein
VEKDAAIGGLIAGAKNLALRAAPAIVPAANRVAEGAMTGGAVSSAFGEGLSGVGQALKVRGAKKLIAQGTASPKLLRRLDNPLILKSTPGAGMLRAGKAVSQMAPLAKLGSHLEPFFDELGKIATELSPQERRNQYLQFAGLGALTGPVMSGIGNLIEHGGIKPPDVTGGKWLASRMVTGAIGMGALPIIRHHIERTNLAQARQAQKAPGV